MNTIRRLIDALICLKVASQAFQIEASVLERVANLCIGLRWNINTTHYIHAVGRPPNYVSPKSWTEKVQWRKVFDRNPLLVVFVDKILAREYMRKMAPEVAIPKILFMGKDPDKIPFNAFAEPYVIKPNHSSGQIIFVENLAEIDSQQIISTCRYWLKYRYGRAAAEWAYKKADPSIIVEEMLSYRDSSAKITNYKFFVFSGKVSYVQFESQTSDAYCLTFFDAAGKRLAVRKWIGRLKPSRMPKPSDDIEVPSKFIEMKRIAERIGREVDMVRVDLYQIGDKIFFSELTPYDGTGFSFLYRDTDSFKGHPPQDLNDEIGKLWKLPRLGLWKRIKNFMLG